MSRFSDYLKNILLIVIIVQFIPGFFHVFKHMYESVTESKTKVGVVPIRGLIVDSNRYVKELKKFFKDPSIKAIVLKIDSPGGAPGTAQAVFQEVKALKHQYVKPVIAYSENLCASAAYYIACSADHIITQSSSLVGSIGVYMGYPNLQEFIEQYKIKYTTIQTGDYKTAGMIFKDLTPQQRAMFQSITDDTYQQFVKDVASRRPKVASADPKKWADGKVFTGKQAFDLGLVDELGSLSTVIKTIKCKVQVDEDITWVYPPKRGLFERVFGSEETEFEEDSETSSISKAITKAVVETACTPISM